MAHTSHTIRPITPADRAGWDKLWAGYLDFYQARLSADMSELTFHRLVHNDGLHGLIALDAEGQAIGFVHYLFHHSSWSRGGNCYLEDLFVTPGLRGISLGRALIAACEEAARAQGAARLYWHTEEFNGQARRLYERVAKRAPFVRYQKDLTGA